MLLGIDNWSFSFAWGMRREFRPARPLRCQGLLRWVKENNLKGAQVGVGDMPPLGSADFIKLKEEIAEAGLFWEVSAGMVKDEARVFQALEYAVALNCRVVRAYMEGFGIQFKHDADSLDDYVADCISHIKHLVPEFERRETALCLENHGGLRLRHMRRVLASIPSNRLGLNLDTGNAVLTMEDPLEVVRELAPRTYTAHLKDWNLVRTPDGIIARGCALGEGVIDLPAAVDILKRQAPEPELLHLNIEAPQEFLPLDLFRAEFWKHHAEVNGKEIGQILALTEKRNADPADDYRLAVQRGAAEAEILAEEEASILRSIRYARKELGL